MKVLLISPHTDDIEFWASGYVFTHPEHEYYHIALSPCAQALTDGYTVSDIYSEWIEAQAMMGIDKHSLYYYADRDYSSIRQEILDLFHGIGEEFDPDMVFAPTVNDVHQDHRVVGFEAVRAFHNKTIIQYMSLRSYSQNDYNYFVTITEPILAKKLELMRNFKSQLAIKPYDDYVLKTMEYFGSMFGERCIEPFVAYRRIE